MMEEIMKIDKNKTPPKKRVKWKFDEMKPGDSFPFKGDSKDRSAVAQAFSQFLAKGRYSIIKEGDGYRFYWLMKEDE